MKKGCLKRSAKDKEKETNPKVNIKQKKKVKENREGKQP